MLGKPPAFPGHEVPGKMVGYMPQVRPSLRDIYASLFSALMFSFRRARRTCVAHANAFDIIANLPFNNVPIIHY